MKMTKEQVAELLIKANEDFSNVEVYVDGRWVKSGADNEVEVLEFILNENSIYRIKDNAVKEITPALRDRWAINKFNKIEHLIIGLCYDKQRIAIGGGWYALEEFNKQWQLVED